jgi:hypothetical protein
VIREYRLEIDYCACMVAIALYRLRIDNDNIDTQFSPETLSEELNLQSTRFEAWLSNVWGLFDERWYLYSPYVC